MDKITANLIAPCGINCSVCRAYLREKNKCPGCNFPDNGKPKTCRLCKIKLCIQRKGKFCFECNNFPCDRLKHLNKRYRNKYKMSEIENLEQIRDHGIERFLENQDKKYRSDKGTFCVHDQKFYSN